jgi:hypothetical protein
LINGLWRWSQFVSPLIDQWSAMALLWRKGKMLIHHFIDRWMIMPFLAKSCWFDVWMVWKFWIIIHSPPSRHCVR